jgi:tetratricopeptide (TPR) repeat protein
LTRRYYTEALAMRRQLYSPKEYPSGHHHIAESLFELGSVLALTGEFSKARTNYLAAMRMFRDLYPKGHRSLALSLSVLADDLAKEGAYKEANVFGEAALETLRRLYPKKGFSRRSRRHCRRSRRNGPYPYSPDQLSDCTDVLQDEAIEIWRALYPPIQLSKRKCRPRDQLK